MKKFLYFLSLISLLPFSAFSFDKTEHDAIAYIAECNLTTKAKKNINKYLNGKSIVYYSSWMDDYRYTDPYKETTKWHMSEVDTNFNYIKGNKGNAVGELENAINILNKKKFKKLPDSIVELNIKYIVHIIGDMHCPSHIFYPDIKDGWFKIKIYNNEYTYHSVWDGRISDYTHKWHYMEWQHQLDIFSKKEKAKMSEGSPKEWFHETAVYCYQIYNMAEPEKNYGLDFLNEAHPIVEHQIILAGYRLAKVLNDIFG